MSQPELDPDALWAAQCAYTDVYDGPYSGEAAMAAAINAYLAAMGLQAVNAALRKYYEDNPRQPPAEKGATS